MEALQWVDIRALFRILSPEQKEKTVNYLRYLGETDKEKESHRATANQTTIQIEKERI